MVAIGGAIFFGGYQLIAYGWSQLQGQNAGFWDMFWPGRYKGNTPDAGSPAGASNPSSNAGGLTGAAGAAADAAGQPNGTGLGGSGLFGKGSLYGDTIGKIIH